MNQTKKEIDKIAELVVTPCSRSTVHCGPVAGIDVSGTPGPMGFVADDQGQHRRMVNG